MQIHRAHSPADLARPRPRADPAADDARLFLGGRPWRDVYPVMRALFQLLRDADWEAAHAIQEFVGTDDALVIALVLCPSDNGVAVLELDSPFELAFNTRSISRRSLSDEHGASANPERPDREFEASFE